MTFVLLMAQLGMVLIVAMMLGQLAERLRLPAIAGQLMAGVVLGPTVFGAAVPPLYARLFPPHDAVLKTVRTDFLQVGLLLFIFFVGLEVDLGRLRPGLDRGPQAGLPCGTVDGAPRAPGSPGARRDHGDHVAGLGGYGGGR